MRITESLAKKVTEHAARVTDGRIGGVIGGGYSNQGYRITNMRGAAKVWESRKGEARQAMAYYLGAIDAYTEGADMPEWLEAVRNYVAWRPEVEESLNFGRHDGASARVKAIKAAEKEAAERMGVTRGHTSTRDGFDRTPVLDVEGGERYRLVPFAPKGAIAEPGNVLAYNVHVVNMPELRERYTVGTLGGDRVAWHEDGYAWEGFKGYQVRTEDRGHGIIAVYVKGSAHQTRIIDRTANAWARKNLTFEDGLSARGNGGGEFRDAGATYIAQAIFTTKRLAPRED